jgi:4-hydroxy-3-methylbut-2-enyl diphosphate reductase
MKELEINGVVKVSSIDEIPNDSAIMFSAHGTAPEIIQKAEEKGLIVIDGTCSIVNATQESVKEAAENGNKIIIIGDKQHQEVISLIGYAKNKDVFVVCDDRDIELLPNFSNDQVLYFVQTTFNYIVLDHIIDLLRKMIPHIMPGLKNNVCYAVKERQEALYEVAGFVDIVVIISSAHSANGGRLEEIAKLSGAKNVFMIESKDSFDLKVLENISTMAIVSATSCPKNSVDEFVEFLQENSDITIGEFPIEK